MTALLGWWWWWWGIYILVRDRIYGGDSANSHQRTKVTFHRPLLLCSSEERALHKKETNWNVWFTKSPCQHRHTEHCDIKSRNHPMTLFYFRGEWSCIVQVWLWASIASQVGDQHDHDQRTLVWFPAVLMWKPFYLLLKMNCEGSMWDLCPKGSL